MSAVKLQELLLSYPSEKQIHYSLDTIKEALKEIGNPEQDLKTIVVGGTNGKGSTTLYLSSILKSAGFSTTTYLSPHLQSVCERFLWNGELISATDLYSLLYSLLPIAKKFRLSYFEFLTIAFFIFCKEKNPDYVILEVGMGGRLDATNVTNPIASIVTSIGWDHMNYLGDTLSKILNEKLGIVRAKSLLFSGVMQIELKKQISKHCKKIATKVTFTDELDFMIDQNDLFSQKFTFQKEQYEIRNGNPCMVKNAILTICLINTVFPKVTIDAIKKGLIAVHNPGRMEIVNKEPLIILSGDHNYEGALTLSETLAMINLRPDITLCAFSPDKPKEKMLSLFETFSKKTIITTFEEAPEITRSILKNLNAKESLLVTGSLYLVGAVRGLWRSEDSFF